MKIQDICNILRKLFPTLMITQSAFDAQVSIDRKDISFNKSIVTTKLRFQIKDSNPEIQKFFSKIKGLQTVSLKIEKFSLEEDFQEIVIENLAKLELDTLLKCFLLVKLLNLGVLTNSKKLKALQMISQTISGKK